MLDADEAGRVSSSLMVLASSQKDHFMDACQQRPFRKQLSILVVEDQVFSQRLLCDILRSARLRTSKETPSIDVAPTVQDAWKLYLKKVPDMVFVDLGLMDGSGHTLSRAIKAMLAP